MEPENPSPEKTAGGNWRTGKVVRRERRMGKRKANQAERARIRDNLQAGLRDPDIFLDLETKRKTTRSKLTSGPAERSSLLQAQKKKVQSELRSTRDLETFLERTSRSRTLYALIAMGYFRHVLESEQYREDHRYKLAIRLALEDPSLSRAIRKKWEAFDEQFPTHEQRNMW